LAINYKLAKDFLSPCNNAVLIPKVYEKVATYTVSQKRETL